MSAVAYEVEPTTADLLLARFLALETRTVKRYCYARAAIPPYLIIDRDESRVLLHSDPAGDDYASGVSVAFGEPLPLPEPFTFSLETAELL